MSTKHAGEVFATEPPRISRAEVDRIVRKAERMRAEHVAGLLRSAGRGIARLARAAVKLPARAGRRRGAGRAAALDPFSPQPRLN